MTTRKAYERAHVAHRISWDGRLPVNPKEIAAGISMVRRHGDSESMMPIKMEGRSLDGISGFAEYKDDVSPYFLCVYNNMEAPTRQRFTQAHELGHVLLNHVGKNRSPKRDTTFQNNEGDPAETEANRFAAELIMPERYVRHLSSKITDISSLAREFGVSPWAMRYRLENLRIL